MKFPFARLFRRRLGRVPVIAATEAALPSALLSTPEPFASKVRSSELYRVRLAGAVFATGLVWQPDHCPPGKARITAQRSVRSQRAEQRKKSSVKSKSSDLSDPSQLAASAAGLASGSPSPVLLLVDDLVCVRPSTPLETLDGATPKVTEQAGLGQSERGHDVGDYSLAALIAERLGRANVTVCVSIPDSGSVPARDALYFVVIQDGLVRASTDRCFTDHREALDHLHRWLRILQRQHDTSFRLFLSPGIDIPGHDADRCNLPDLLAGPYPPVLSSIFFRLSRRAKRRFLIVSAVGALLVPVVWLSVAAVQDRIRLAQIEEQRQRLLHAAGTQVAAIAIDPVGYAPWETEPRVLPSQMFAHGVDVLSHVPFSTVPPSDLGAYRLEFARVDHDLVHVAYAELFAPPGGDSLEAPIWPPRYERFDERITVFDVDPRFATVDLQSVADRATDPTFVATDVRSHLVLRLEQLSEAVRLLHRAEFAPSNLVEGLSRQAGHLAWVAQTFELDFHPPFRVTPALGALFDSDPSLQITSVELHISDDAEIWRVTGYLAGVLDLLAETRALEARAAASQDG